MPQTGPLRTLQAQALPSLHCWSKTDLEHELLACSTSISEVKLQFRCRRQGASSVTFVVNVRDHINEIIHAFMNEHATCQEDNEKYVRGDKGCF